MPRTDPLKLWIDFSVPPPDKTWYWAKELSEAVSMMTDFTVSEASIGTHIGGRWVNPVSVLLEEIEIGVKNGKIPKMNNLELHGNWKNKLMNIVYHRCVERIKNEWIVYKRSLNNIPYSEIKNNIGKLRVINHISNRRGTIIDTVDETPSDNTRETDTENSLVIKWDLFEHETIIDESVICHYLCHNIKEL